MKDYAVGIDVGGTITKFALFKGRKIIYKNYLDTHLYKKATSLIEAIVNKVDEICFTNKISEIKILGIGIGLAGIVDFRKGIVYNLTNIKGWHDIKLKQILERRQKTPVYIDNDTNLMGLGEFYFGAARGFKNVIAVTLGTGVGGAVIIDGKLYRGSTFSAGEIGHIPINETGPRCNCGGIACLERYVGNRFIVEEAINQIKQGRRTLIMKLVSNDLTKITPKIITKASRLGDKFSLQVWKNAGIHIGIALSGIVNIFNPDAIVIGGGLSNAGRVLIESIKATINLRAMPPAKDIVKILKSKLGDDAGLFGALQLVRQG